MVDTALNLPLDSMEKAIKIVSRGRQSVDLPSGGSLDAEVFHLEDDPPIYRIMMTRHPIGKLVIDGAMNPLFWMIYKVANAEDAGKIGPWNQAQYEAVQKSFRDYWLRGGKVDTLADI